MRAYVKQLCELVWRSCVEKKPCDVKLLSCEGTTMEMAIVVTRTKMALVVATEMVMVMDRLVVQRSCED